MKRRRDIDLVKVRRGGRKKTKQNKKIPQLWPKTHVPRREFSQIGQVLEKFAPSSYHS